MPNNSGPPVVPGQLKVMISSTALDLPDHRRAVIDAVFRAGCFPLAMEHGTATSNSDALRFSRNLIDQADIYLGIFALRYGFVPDNPKENPQGWSVTEHEYRCAVARDIPRLIYIADKTHRFPEEDIDFDPEKRAKLLALKEELRREICGFFTSAEELQARVVQSLFEEKEKHRPAVVRFQSSVSLQIPQPPELYAVPPYTLTNTFVGRRTELSDLDLWAASSDTVLVIEAIGGMGKSALTWEWVHQRSEASISGLVGRVWWSFYERGTSMKTFLRHTLSYITRQDLKALKDLDTHTCGQQILTELKRRPYLLVLDGFERVLTAYNRTDKAQLSDHLVPVDARECMNPRDGDILRQLVQCGPSKILVSTRLMPKVLADRHTRQLLPGVRHLELKGLAPKDALEMIWSAEIKGDAAAVLRFVDQFDRHSLALRIVCGMITDYRSKPKDFDAWLADPYAGGGLKLSDLPLVQRYTHILEYAFLGLEDKTRQLLSRIAVLSDGADYDTIAVLNPFLPTEQDTEREPEGLAAYPVTVESRKALIAFHSALRDLEDRGLLQWDRKANTYDLHPVVRAHAFERLEDRERTQAYNVIRDHFASLPPENFREATELVHVKNSLEIMRALVGARRYEAALELYQGDFGESLMFSIGAFHEIVELLDPLARCDKDGIRYYAVNDLACALTELGRSEEALLLFGEKIRDDFGMKDWYEVAIGLQNWAACALSLNQLASAQRAREIASGLSETVGYEVGITFSILTDLVLSTVMGRFGEAESLCRKLQERRSLPSTLSQPGSTEYWFARLQFYQGQLTPSEMDRSDKIAIQGRSIKRQHQSLALRAEWELTRGNLIEALEAIEAAVSAVRRTGTPTQDYLALRALALSRLGRSSEASEALAEAEDASGSRTARFPMFAAETCLVLGDRTRACEYVRRAYLLAWADGAPYLHFHCLKRCRELMLELDEPEPQLPEFDPARVEPVPFESGIWAAIERLKAEAARAKWEKSWWFALFGDWLR